MQFTVALVGPTNVGKSTLFNKLTGKNFALINDFHHFTRDRKYGILKFRNFYINIIDTAGIEKYKKNNDILKKKIMYQTFIGIKQSDLILFIININDVITYEYMIIINMLRKKNKKIFLIINKIDIVKNYLCQSHDFYSLGITEIIFISALKNIGLDVLKQKIKIFFKNNLNSTNIFKKNMISNSDIIINNNITCQKNIIITIVGKPNVGKSTLLNTLLNQNRMVTHNLPGTTRDSIAHDMLFLNQKYTIIDTSGINKKNHDKIQSLPVMQTLHAVHIAHIVILLIDATQEISKQDIWILNTVIQSGKLLLIIFNKSENLSVNEKNFIKNNLRFKQGILKFFKIHFISALYKTGINKIFSLINCIYHHSKKIMKSSQLTKIMYHAIHEHPPENIQGKKIKLKYAHPGGYFPPTIIIHGNKISYISNSYKRYLLNFFQKKLNFKNTNIKIIFKNIKNPYTQYK